jgi:SAM-dependent methyltransferase
VPAARTTQPAPTRPADGPPSLEFPSAWPDWHRRKRVAERHFLPWIERVMPLAGRTILEYGSGNGPVSAAFAPHAGRYIGVDIAAEDVETSRRILAEGGLHPELHAAPPAEILELTATFRGEVDVFLCAAVLEHMSVQERLDLLRLAREILRPDGIIVVFETPNRLTPWDYHTSLQPFLNQLPEELALAYLRRSPREDFVEAMRAAAERGPESERETYVRWGRGMSFHELELVFDDLPRHVVASSWDPLLLEEREVYRDEVALQRVMDEARPDLPGAFSRYWLDFILAVTPRDEPARFLRPWRLQTTGSRHVAYDAGQYLRFERQDAVLRVELPSSSSRLVVGAERLAEPLHVTVRAASGAVQRAVLEPGRAAYADLQFATPEAVYEVELDTPGTLSLILYEG